jgi:hypothetical protein
MQAIAMDCVRSVAWLFLLAAILVPLERAFADRPQRLVRPQFAVDLAYFFINGIGTAAALAALGGLLATAAQACVPEPVRALSAGLGLWQRMLATLVVGEFGFYWGHRLSHHVPLLWRFHAVHHSARQVDWLTSSRGHPVDIVFTRTCGFALIHAAGLAGPDVAGGSTAVAAATVFTIFWGFFIHANLRWRMGWLELLIATPAFHRWHHTNDAHRDRNFASTLPFYDWLFGTMHLPSGASPPVFGCDTAVAGDLVGQLAGPLVARPGLPEEISTRRPNALDDAPPPA